MLERLHKQHLLHNHQKEYIILSVVLIFEASGESLCTARKNT